MAFFTAASLGYLLAILITVAISKIYGRGQPALLYLVPGCFISILMTAIAKGKVKELWNFSDNELIDDLTNKKSTPKLQK